MKEIEAGVIRKESRTTRVKEGIARVAKDYMKSGYEAYAYKRNVEGKSKLRSSIDAAAQFFMPGAYHMSQEMKNSGSDDLGKIVAVGFAAAADIGAAALVTMGPVGVAGRYIYGREVTGLLTEEARERWKNGGETGVLRDLKEQMRQAEREAKKEKIKCWKMLAK